MLNKKSSSHETEAKETEKGIKFRMIKDPENSQRRREREREKERDGIINYSWRSLDFGR